MLLVGYDDVEAMYPELGEKASPQYVATLIDKATRLLYQRVPRIDERVEAGTLDGALVADKIIEAVLRVIRNPNPEFQQETELGYSYTINRRLASGDIWFPDSDIDLLRPPARRYGSIPIGLPCHWGRP